ncbi:hypothetical protein ACFL59_16090, partial [Planctomycetota bacterium]
MVFRLGSPPGSRTTSFALARAVDGWGDYFLFDDELFGDVDTKTFSPTSSDDLLAYQLLPVLTERSVVNLAVASGLLDEALRL